MIINEIKEDIKNEIKNFKFNFKSEKQEKYYNNLVKEAIETLDIDFEEIEDIEDETDIYFTIALASYDDEIEESSREWSLNDCKKHINKMMTKDAFEWLKNLG